MKRIFLISVIGAASVLLPRTGLTQDDYQRLATEIVRMSEAGESENGFCASTNWPNGNDREIFSNFLRGAQVGTSKVDTYNNGNCQLDRVTGIFTEKGGKCVAYTSWSCSQGGTCGTIKTVDCLDRNGTFVSRRPG